MEEFRGQIEEYRAIKDVIRKHGIWGWRSGGIAAELDKVLSRKPSADITDVREDLERVVARLQRMEETEEAEATT